MVVEHLSGGGANRYVVVTEHQYTYGTMYGLITPTQLDEFVNAVARHPDFEVRYHSGRNFIARYVGPT
jgi:hypothetical protein